MDFCITCSKAGAKGSLHSTPRHVGDTIQLSTRPEKKIYSYNMNMMYDVNTYDVNTAPNA